MSNKNATSKSSKAVRETPFVAGKVHIIPPWLGGEHPAPQTPRNFCTITLVKGADGYYRPGFKAKSYDPHPEKDEPLDIRIPRGDSYIELDLDPTYNWEFAHRRPIMLGDSTTKGVRYHDLNLNPNGKADHKSASFHATYIPNGGKMNRDPYNLNFLVYIRKAGGAVEPAPLGVTVDPDIKNPGDPP